MHEQNSGCGSLYALHSALVFAFLGIFITEWEVSYSESGGTADDGKAMLGVCVFIKINLSTIY